MKETAAEDQVLQGPDVSVAARIVGRMRDQNLISEDQVYRLMIGLAEGNLRSEDWRVIAENALEQEVRDARATH